MLIDRIEELKVEISQIESDQNLDSEGFSRLKELKKQLVALEAELELQLVKMKPTVRQLLPRDYRLLQSLVETYPGFSKLREDERLDAIVIGLMKGCGLSAINVERVNDVINHLSLSIGLEVGDHFATSTWINREGIEKPRYLSPFENVYKLDPGYILKLNKQAEVADEVPIRKVNSEVKSKFISDSQSSSVVPAAPVEFAAHQSQSGLIAKSELSSDSTAPKRQVEPSRAEAMPVPEESQSVPQPSSQFLLWPVVVVAVLVVGIALFYLLKS